MSWDVAVADRRIARRRRETDVVPCMREHRSEWVIIQRRGNASAFNGYRWQPSAYSQVRCESCGRCWRTKAAYVGGLPDA